MVNPKYRDCSFSGWATRNNLTCGDGRVIRKDAFKDNDGKKVSLVWNHEHNDPLAVLGHAFLENREDGVYAYGYFNDSEAGQAAEKLVHNGDVSSLSIWANKLKQNTLPNGCKEVVHGEIRELSLVLAGANPGAYIDCVMAHSDDADEDSISELYAGYNENIVIHSAESNEKEENEMADNVKKTEGEETVEDVFNTLTEKQKTVVYAMIGQIMEDNGINDDDDDENNDEMGHSEGDDYMKRNVFDNDEQQDEVLSHAAMETIIGDAKRFGSLKESFLAHADEYGIEQIDYLFPEAKTLNNPPEFIKRDTGWVSTVMGAVHHTPFSRIKSVFANITEDEARAKGYIKGNLKKEEVFSLLKRTTTPTTIYKKQKLDRDDVIDITDFDVVAWLKSEMRIMLDEEIARAILIGDGRLSSSDDKINETNIRPVVSDAELYTIRQKVSVAANATDDDKAKAMIKAAVKARKNYKGSGNPTFFTTEDWLTNALLLEDTQGHRLYKNDSEVAAAMRVSKIVTVPVMEGVKGPEGGDLIGIIVNLADYNVGADKGGAVNMFDDFDIDYNQQKYLIETRCSGALIKPYSAIELELDVAAG
ncbi:MAG: phage major capsid protein [Prevotella sp.]|nr:phage major capsid protein [Prevotella sp.]